MREKTAEEKLREELEGDSSGIAHDKELVRRLRAKKSARASNVGKTADSFIDDFERRVQQSLDAGNIFKAPSETAQHKVKSRAVKKPASEIIPAVPKVKAKPEPERIKPEPVIKIIEPEIAPETETAISAPQAEIITPEILPEPEAPIVEPQAPVVEAEAPIVEPETLSEAELVEPEQPAPAVEHENLPEAPSLEQESQPEVINSEKFPEAEPVEPEALSAESEILPKSEVEASSVDNKNFPEVEPVEVEADTEQKIEILPEAELVEPEAQFVETEPEQKNEIVPENEPAEPENLPVPEIVEPEIVETGEPELEASEPENEGELPDIPVIETDEIQNEKTEPENDFLLEGELPDIPVIEADDEEPEQYEENIDAQEPENQEQENSSPADIVLNVDDELPILNDDFTEPDPETEVATLSVTMPESTKTAEDKLMADIAEAMTGSPLNLDSPEAPAPYQLPDNFLNANTENYDTSQQSAEDKLIANIAQAMNESPLDTAQEQARQDLEQDLNPFEELNLPEPINEEPKPLELDQPELEQQEPEETQEQEFLPGFSIDDEPAQNETMPQELQEISSDFSVDDEPTQEGLEPQEQGQGFSVGNEPAQDEPELDEPQEQEQEFLPDFSEEPETEEEQNEPELQQQDDENEALQLSPEEAIALLGDDDDEGEEEDYGEENSGPELSDFIASGENSADEEKEDERQGNEPEILTEEQRLQQEVAKISQAQAENNNGIISPEININIDTQEEVQQENKMPEQSLLDNEQDIDEAGDDWDISSLGELSEAASIPDDEPENVTPQETPTTIIMNNPERAEQEKTMGIREKLAERKSAAAAKKSSSASSSSSGGKSKTGLLLPILLGLLLLAGGFIAWQLHQISDKLTLAMMNASGFESVSGIDTPPSYDYAIDFIIDPNITERMAARGREGWQVVGSRRTQDSTTGQYGYEFIFMRRRTGR